MRYFGCRSSVRFTLRAGLVAGLGLAGFQAWVAPGSAFAEGPLSLSTLKKMSLDDLFQIEVTSAARRPEKLYEIAAAVHVVTAEDIRRSGAVSIPEALRNIPGVEVARIDSRQYAISARGFNGSAANKLLVLMDGRTLYTPLYSGVFWDAQYALPEDIDHIEVIRGPVLAWGANAVNGVINIIRKPAANTQGLMVRAVGGNEERGNIGLQYGGRIGEAGSYRVYGNGFRRDDSTLRVGGGGQDAFDFGQVGFRLDRESAAGTTLSMSGDWYDGTVDQVAPGDVTMRGANLVACWRPGGNPDLEIRALFDRTERSIPNLFAETLNAGNLELQHHLVAGSRHDVIWGLTGRLADDHVENSAMLAFLPADVTQGLCTLFAEDAIDVVPDRFRVSLGAMLEHNHYTGLEAQPGIRCAWYQGSHHVVWASASRAVRTPSRIDRDFYVPAAPPHTILAGGPGFASEVVHAYEAGYRVERSAALTASLSVYYNDYYRLRGVEPGPPATLSNSVEGNSRGAELEVNHDITSHWRLHAGYTLFNLRLHTISGSGDTSAERQEGDSPIHQAFLRSSLDLPHHMETDAALRYVDRLPDQGVRSYVSLDLRVGWAMNRYAAVDIGGHDLLEKQHAEFGTPASRHEIQRSVYARVTRRF